MMGTSKSRCRSINSPVSVAGMKRNGGTVNYNYNRFTRGNFAPLVRASEKVGRNQVCPCGSGKKFKHCCIE